VRALVDNALKHTPAGTVVTLAAAEEDGTAYLTVLDDGPGIPEAALDHLFERFYRAPGAAPQGSGLGLAIANELALRMGGRLAVDSRPGRTTFTLELAAVAVVPRSRSGGRCSPASPPRRSAAERLQRIEVRMAGEWARGVRACPV